MENDNQEIIKEAKHLFMAFRNGIISDTLRKAGMPYRVIFGLQLPQLSQICRDLVSGTATRGALSPSGRMELADTLWQDREVRESRLLACYLYMPDAVTEEKALGLARDVRTREEADILCFRILRYLPFARSLARQLSESGDDLAAYCATALLRNLDA